MSSWTLPKELRQEEEKLSRLSRDFLDNPGRGLIAMGPPLEGLQEYERAHAGTPEATKCRNLRKAHVAMVLRSLPQMESHDVVSLVFGILIASEEVWDEVMSQDLTLRENWLTYRQKHQDVFDWIISELAVDVRKNGDGNTTPQ